MPYKRISKPPFHLLSPFLGMKAMPVVSKSDAGFEYGGRPNRKQRWMEWSSTTSGTPVIIIPPPHTHTHTYTHTHTHTHTLAVHNNSTIPLTFASPIALYVFLNSND
jgi:hypothetical protein